MVVEEAAEEAIEFLVEDQLPREENRIWKLLGDLQAKPLQFHDDIRSQARSELGVEAEVRREPAILEHIIGNLLLELTHLLGTFQQRRVDLADADENDIGKLPFEQSRNFCQGGQSQAVEAVDQQHCGRSIRIAVGRWLHRRREDFRQYVSLELLDGLGN